MERGSVLFKQTNKQTSSCVYLFIYLFGSACVCVLSHSIMFFHPPGKAQKGYAPVRLKLTTLALLCMYYCIRPCLTYCATGAPSQAQTGHEHGALMNEISILIIETPEHPLALPIYKDTMGSLQCDKRPYLSMRYPGSRSSRLRSVRNTFVLFTRSPSLQDFVIAARTDRGLSKREVHIDSWLRNIT